MLGAGRFHMSMCLLQTKLMEFPKQFMKIEKPNDNPRIILILYPSLIEVSKPPPKYLIPAVFFIASCLIYNNTALFCATGHNSQVKTEKQYTSYNILPPPPF